MSLQRKTIKRSHDEIIEHNQSKTEMSKFSQFLDDTVNNAYKRPWHRLEHGLRLNRLRIFVADEKERMNLSQVEAANLLLLLQNSLDKKLLNSKTAINYDMDTEKILEIKGLVSHREADGFLKFQFMEKKATNVTMKRKHSIPSTQAK